MDSIANMLVHIKNAGNARKDSVTFPHSAMKMAIVTKMQERGFVGNIEKKGKERPTITVEILYDEKGKPRMTDMSRVSKLSRRVYRGYKEIKPVRRGYGMLIVSTPKGILTGEEAVKAQVGGEMICTLW